MNELTKAALEAVKKDEKRQNMVFTPRHAWWKSQDKDAKWIKQQENRLNIRGLI